MKKSRWSLLLVLGGLCAPAALVAEEAALGAAGKMTAAAEEEANTQYLGYGFALTDGQVAIAADTAFVLSPETGTLVVRREEMDRAKETLNADASSDTEWTVVTPDKERITVRLLFPAHEYDSDEIKAPSEGSSLPVIEIAKVIQLPLPGVAYRWRWRYACGTLGNCGPLGCHGYYSTHQIGNHLVCRYTGNFWDLCLERLAPVCLTRQWECWGCKGALLGQWIQLRWVCATF